MVTKKFVNTRSMAPRKKTSKKMSKQEQYLAKLAAMPQPVQRQPPIDYLAWKKPTTTEAKLEIKVGIQGTTA